MNLVALAVGNDPKRGYCKILRINLSSVAEKDHRGKMCFMDKPTWWQKMSLHKSLHDVDQSGRRKMRSRDAGSLCRKQRRREREVLWQDPHAATAWSLLPDRYEITHTHTHTGTKTEIKEGRRSTWWCCYTKTTQPHISWRWTPSSTCCWQQEFELVISTGEKGGRGFEKYI